MYRQFKIHGNIVNVPADVRNTVNMLPHLQSQTGTVKINLKGSYNTRVQLCH